MIFRRAAILFLFMPLLILPACNNQPHRDPSTSTAHSDAIEPGQLAESFEPQNGWEVRPYFDNSGDSTSEHYIQTRGFIAGSVNNGDTQDSTLAVRMLVDTADGVRVFFMLFENGGRTPVKNHQSNGGTIYAMQIIDNYGQIYEFRGVNWNDRIIFRGKAGSALHEIMRKYKRLHVHMYESDSPVTGYYFTIDCVGYSAAYREL